MNGSPAIQFVVGGHRDLVGQQGGDVGVDGGVAARQRLDGDQLDARLDDDAELPEAAAHAVEEGGVAGRRAHLEVTVAGDDPQLERVVGL